MIPLPLLDGDTLLIDNSSLETFTTCPRSAQYLFCQRRKSTSERSSLRFGQIIHQVLELRYKTPSPYAQTPDVERLMMSKADEEFRAWENQDPEDFRNFSCATELIRLYGTTYPFEEFQILNLGDKPFVEVPFMVPLGKIAIKDSLNVRQPDGQVVLRWVDTIKVVWTGKIDLAYRYLDRVYIMDHKTTSIMGPSYFLEFEDSHQFIGYSWAAEKLLGEKVHGAVVNAIGVRKPTKTGKAFEFKRQPIHIADWQKEEWVSDTMYIVSDFIEMVRRGMLPKHRRWCVGKYGPCPYRSVCTLPPDQRDMMLSSGEFQDATWSPLHSNA